MANAVDVIARDQRALESLFRRYEHAHLPARRREFCETFREALLRHIDMKEEIFYPVLEREGSDEVKQQVEESYAKLQEMRTLAEDMEGLEDDGAMDIEARGR